MIGENLEKFVKIMGFFIYFFVVKVWNIFEENRELIDSLLLLINKCFFIDEMRKF